MTIRNKPEAMLKIALAFFDFHGTFSVVIDDPRFTFRPTDCAKFLNDFGCGGCSRANCTRAPGATESTVAAKDAIHAIAREQRRTVFEWYEQVAAHRNFTLLGEIERYDRN